MQWSLLIISLYLVFWPTKAELWEKDMSKEVLQCLRISIESAATQSSTSIDQGRCIGLPGSQEFTMLKGIALLKKYFPDPTKLPQVLKKMRVE